MAPRSTADSGSFRRPVVRSGGAVRRPAAAPRLVPCPPAEWAAGRANPSPTRDGFAIGDSSGFDVASFHETQSHDRGTPAEWNQSLARRRLSAKGSAVWTALHGYPCLGLVVGTHRRR